MSLRRHALASLNRGKTKVLSAAAVVLVALACSLALIFLMAPTKVEGAAALPSGIHESVAFSGLTDPIKVEFSEDGRVFVANKSGSIMVWRSEDSWALWRTASSRCPEISRAREILGWEPHVRARDVAPEDPEVVRPALEHALNEPLRASPGIRAPG